MELSAELGGTAAVRTVWWGAMLAAYERVFRKIASGPDTAVSWQSTDTAVSRRFSDALGHAKGQSTDTTVSGW